MNKKNKGTSIIEMIICLPILLFLTLMVFKLISSGVKNVNASFQKSKIVAEDITSMLNMSGTIENSTWGSFVGSYIKGIWYFPDDYRHPLVLQSAQDSKGKIVSDSSGIPRMQRFIVYYIVRPEGDRCTLESHGEVLDVPNPDNYCPHKRLIRKDFTPTSFGGSIALASLGGYLNNDLSVGGRVLAAKVISNDVLGFDVDFTPYGTKYTVKLNGADIKLDDTSVGFNIKKFRMAEYQKDTHAGNDLTAYKDKYFEISNRAIPKS